MPVRKNALLRKNEFLPASLDSVGGRDRVEEGKKFRICTAGVMLTYKGHLDKAELEDFFYAEEYDCGKRKKKNPGIEEFLVAHEGGKNGEYRHTHVIVKWKRDPKSNGGNFESSSPRIFDWNGTVEDMVEFEKDPEYSAGVPMEDVEPGKEWVLMKRRDLGVHPYIIACPRTYTARWGAWVKYLCKEDKDNKNVNAFVSAETSVDGIIAAEDLVTAVKQNAQDKVGRLEHSKILPTMALYDRTRTLEKEKLQAKRLMNRYQKMVLREWQQELVDELNLGDKDVYPSSRKIIYYVDKVGNAGKSAVCDWLECHHPEQVVKGKLADQMSYMIVEKADKAGLWRHNNTVLLIDIARSSNGENRGQTLNKAMVMVEEVKDGDLEHQKYKGNSMKGWVPHVVVMSNFYIRPKSLSADRADVRVLEREAGGLITVRRITFEEACEAYARQAREASVDELHRQKAVEDAYRESLPEEDEIEAVY